MYNITNHLRNDKTFQGDATSRLSHGGSSIQISKYTSRHHLCMLTIVNPEKDGQKVIFNISFLNIFARPSDLGSCSANSMAFA